MRRLIILVLSLLVLVGFSQGGYAQFRIKPAPKINAPVKSDVIQSKRATIPDYPQIREFSLAPSSWLNDQTGNIVFRWRVDPSPTGSAVRQIAITRTAGAGPVVNHTNSNANSQYSLAISSSPRLSEGSTTYTLTATDQKGAVSRRTVTFEIKSMITIRSSISLDSLRTDPAALREGSPFTFILRLNNGSGIRVPDVTFPIRGKDIGVMEVGGLSGSEAPPPNQGELRDQVINPGINEYRIRCSPGIPAGLMERYLFEMIPKYKNISIINVSARIDSDGRIRVFERRF